MTDCAENCPVAGRVEALERANEQHGKTPFRRSARAGSSASMSGTASRITPRQPQLQQRQPVLVLHQQPRHVLCLPRLSWKYTNTYGTGNIGPQAQLNVSNAVYRYIAAGRGNGV